MQIVIPDNINKGWLARELWPLMKPESARAKFHNKLKNDCRMKFSDDEIKKNKRIVKIVLAYIKVYALLYKVINEGYVKSFKNEVFKNSKQRRVRH